MKKNFLLLIFTSVIFLFVSCDEPIFFMVAMEEPPLKPRINGSPTNFAEFNTEFDLKLDITLGGSPLINIPFQGTEPAVFVASGNRLFVYLEGDDDFDGVWISSDGFSSRIIQLAATNGNFYFFTLNDSNGSRTLQRVTVPKVTSNLTIDVLDALDVDEDKLFNDMLKNSTFTYTATPVDLTGVNGSIMSIFAANNRLFICTYNASAYEIYSITDNDPNPPQPLTIATDDNFGFLNGVAFSGGNYFLSSLGSIFRVSGTGTAADKVDVQESGAGNFTGILALKSGQVVTLTRGGSLYLVQASPLQIGSFIARFPGSRWSNSMGTLFVYEPKTGDSILLAGTQDSSVSTSTGNTHGYMELVLSGNGITTPITDPNPYSFNWPGRENHSTVDSYDKFVSTLGKQGVNHLYQAADGILFASTHQRGVWAYRYRKSGNYSWNAEE